MARGEQRAPARAPTRPRLMRLRRLRLSVASVAAVVVVAVAVAAASRGGTPTLTPAAAQWLPIPSKPPTSSYTVTLYITIPAQPDITCNTTTPKWLVLQQTTLFPPPVLVNDAQNQISFDGVVESITMSGEVKFNTCPGTNDVCNARSQQNTIALSLYAAAPSVGLVSDLVSVSGTLQFSQTVSAGTSPIRLWGNSTIGFVFKTSFCSGIGSSSASLIADVRITRRPETASAPSQNGSQGQLPIGAAGWIAGGVVGGVLLIYAVVAGRMRAMRARGGPPPSAGAGARRHDGRHHRRDPEAPASTFRPHVGTAMPPPSPTRATSTFTPSTVPAVPVAAVVTSDAVSDSSRQFIPVASEAAAGSAGDVGKV